MPFKKTAEQIERRGLLLHRYFRHDRTRARARVVVIDAHNIRINAAQLSHCVEHFCFIRERNVQVIVCGSALIKRARRHFVVSAADRAQIVQGRQGAKFYINTPFFSQRDDGNALCPARLRKRIFQWRAAVTNGFAPYALCAVNVAQCNVIVRIKQRSVYVLRPADAQLFRAARFSACDKLMRKQNAAPSFVRRVSFQHSGHCLLITFDGIVRIKRTHGGRLYKRQQPHVHFAVRITECTACHCAVEHRRKINAAVLQKPPGKRQTLRRIVIARHKKNGALQFLQAGEEVIKQCYCLAGRHTFIVNIAGNQHRFYGFIYYNLYYFI